MVVEMTTSRQVAGSHAALRPGHLITVTVPPDLVIPPPTTPGSYDPCTHKAPTTSCARLVVAE